LSLLEQINSSADLKNLSRDELPLLAEEIRIAIVEVVSKTGGHLAPSLGAVELAIAIHYVFDTPREKVIWDVGHQAYAHKLITGRRDQFNTLRQFRGLSGFTRRSESPYDAFSTGHSSTSISASLGIATDSLSKTVYNVLMDDNLGLTSVMMKTRHGFDLAPSNIDLAGAEVELKQLLAAEQVLRRNLEEIVDDYDFIFFDCPPSLGMLTINALTAARELLIPMSMEYLALRGLDMLAKTVAKIRAVTNPELSYLGILATKYDRRTLNSREIHEALQAASRQSGIRLFNTYITNSVRFTESPSAHTPLILANPDHEGAKAYMSIVEQIIHG